MRAQLAGLGALVAVTLAGCSAGTGTPAPARATTAAPAPTATAATTAAPAAGGADLTAPGTTLKVGQRAVVANMYGSAQGVIGVTVTAIDKGSAAEIAPLNLGDRAKGKIPYYLRLTVTNVGGTDLKYSGVSNVYGLLPDDSQAGSVVVMGTFDKCANATAPADFTTGGATYQSCVLVLAPEASAVTGVSLTDGKYKGKQWTWK